MKEYARKLDQKIQVTLRRRANAMNRQGRGRCDVAEVVGGDR